MKESRDDRLSGPSLRRKLFKKPHMAIVSAGRVFEAKPAVSSFISLVVTCGVDVMWRQSVSEHPLCCRRSGRRRRK